ncbi:hypothetical protein GGI17_004960 [Coemansia sp. S146]|nr:hypothetical protein GGI17_004960 [Coemansia sp. S146]
MSLVLLPTLAKGLGPAGIHRFPQISPVNGAVRTKRKTLSHVDHDFNLLAAITQTVREHGTINCIGLTTGSTNGQRRVHSHSMHLNAVVQVLQKRHKALGDTSLSYVRSVIVSCSGLAPGTIYVIGIEPNTFNQPSETSLVTARGLIVQQSIDAYSTVERLRCEAKKIAHVKYLPTLDHVANATLSNLSHSELLKLGTGIAKVVRFWKPSAYNISDVNDLVTRIETLARKVSQGRSVSAQLFGSHNYGLCSNQSDVDITVSVSSPRGSGVQETDATNRSFFNDLSAILHKSADFTRVTLVTHAHVPIIKFVFVTRSKYRLEGDISLNGGKGLVKSRLIATYLGLDLRVGYSP